jgi:hypothetical protein
MHPDSESSDTVVPPWLTTPASCKAPNVRMPDKPLQHQQSNKDKPASPQQQREKSGRSGEGVRSVIPHLLADRRARAVARIGKQGNRET